MVASFPDSRNSRQKNWVKRASYAKSPLARPVIRCLSSKNVPIHGLSRSLCEEAIKWLIFPIVYFYYMQITHFRGMI